MNKQNSEQAKYECSHLHVVRFARVPGLGASAVTVASYAALLTAGLFDWALTDCRASSRTERCVTSVFTEDDDGM